MASIRNLKDNGGNVFYPLTHERAVKDSNGVSLESKLAGLESKSYVEAWDGASTPVVANIPAGVTVTYNTTTYTGTLTASADTIGKIYLVKNGNDYDRYITSQSGSSYSWSPIGSTEMDLSGYAKTKDVSQLRQEVIVPISLNRFDKGKVSVGYVRYTDGVVVSNSGYRASDFIPVEPGTRYRITDNGNQQLAIYDVDRNYVSGYVNSNSFNTADASTQIPQNGAYLRFTVSSSEVDSCGFYDAEEYIARNAWENTLTFKDGIVADELIGKVKDRTVTVGSMQILLNVLATIIDTDNYHYTIYMVEGSYNLTPEQIDSIQTEQYGRIGILLPNNVDLVGLGKGVTIICDLTGKESGYQGYISPINLKWNNRLENIAIVANNCRYCVHADNANTAQNIKWEIINCDFVHYGNSDNGWSYPHAWGEGGCSGHYAYFRNCKFRSPGTAFYIHNATGMERPLYHEFDGCSFTSLDKIIAFQAESLASGTNDVLNFKGCNFDGLFDSRVGSGAPSGTTSCDWVVIGGGNSPVCENWYYTDGVSYHSCFGDEVIRFQNKTGAAISAGTFMKYDDDDLVPMVDGDDGKTFVGFLLDNVTASGVGYVKVKGAYRIISPSEVVWATLGTRVKVASYNSLGVATDIYNIGKMYYRNTTYTRYYILLD